MFFILSCSTLGDADQTVDIFSVFVFLYLISLSLSAFSLLLIFFKLQNLLTLLLYSLISTGCRSAAGFNTKQLSPASTLSLVQLLHTSPSCFTSILLLVLFVQPQILGFSVSHGCAGGLFGRDPFSISDLSSGTLFLSLLGMPRHSPFSSQN